MYSDFMYSVFFACLDEVHQAFIPLRKSSLFDCIADILGIKPKTYQIHWKNIKDKLDVKREIECLLFAIENKISES